MREWLTRAVIVGVCGAGLVIVSGLTPQPVLCIVGGAVLLVGAVFFAVIGLRGDERVFGAVPEHRRLRGAFHGRALSASALTLVAVAIFAFPAFPPHHVAVALMLGGIIAVLSAFHWFRAVRAYRRLTDAGKDT